MGEPTSTPTGFAFFRRLARRFGVPARHAEDLAQDALLRELEAEQRVDLDLGEARARYGATIVLNQARNHVRNERRRREVLTSFDDHELQAECPSPEELLRGRQREALIRDLINQVDPKYRGVLIKHGLEEVPLVEIASELGLKPKTVRTQYRRALEDLAAAVERRRARQRSRGWDETACVPFAIDLRGSEGWLSKLGRLGIRTLIQGAVVVLTGAVIATLPDSFSPESWLRAAVVHAPAPAPEAQEIAPPPAQRHMQTMAMTAATAAQEIAPLSRHGDARVPAPSGAPARRTSLPVRAVAPAAGERERILIDEARRAIEAHNALADAEARQLLEIHAREFPQGQLAAEREALLTQIR
ncbi:MULTISPECIES: RNA polymerase sigma factor [Sorangium]|uniref:RNA polymerase sigma factor n=1 Tax=Sorangium cellulosum TaxID=56 RepID=A0A4P2QJ16_SORCE|nr:MULTISPECIES: sigma-70 family RNA polymerase sigma factor [Sorangium]AUX29373.1 RNA polymerase sigma factor [Sorangium cellulosum]WCQ88765.1 RNA polymerase sigma factor [Sorangium sp. Soce836]